MHSTSELSSPDITLTTLIFNTTKNTVMRTNHIFHNSFPFLFPPSLFLAFDLCSSWNYYSVKVKNALLYINTILSLAITTSFGKFSLIKIAERCRKQWETPVFCLSLSLSCLLIRIYPKSRSPESLYHLILLLSDFH
jgi:hypothetical protein